VTFGHLGQCVHVDLRLHTRVSNHRVNNVSRCPDRCPCPCLCAPRAGLRTPTMVRGLILYAQRTRARVRAVSVARSCMLSVPMTIPSPWPDLPVPVPSPCFLSITVLCACIVRGVYGDS
jgi:hypothetical protein